MVSPMMDFSREISERFPLDQEDRHRYKLRSPWSFGELKAIRTFEFQYLETKEKYRQFSRYELHLNFWSFGKELPFKTVYYLNDEKEIKSVALVRPSYLYPDEICLEDDPEIVKDFKIAGITIEEGDKVTTDILSLGAVDSPQMCDCLKILEDLINISKDSNKATRIDPPSYGVGWGGKG